MKNRLMMPITASALLIILLISACAPVTPGIPQTGVETEVTITPVSTVDITHGTAETTGPEGSAGDGLTGDLEDQVGQSALGFLAEQLNLPEDRFSVVEVSQQTWPDSCLGLGDTNEVCSQVEVKGYRAVIEREDGQWYIVRTDGNVGSMRVVFGNPGNPQDVVIPDDGDTSDQGSMSAEGRTIPAGEAADIARIYLSRVLNVPMDQVSIVSVEAAEWDDVCLGTGAAGETCFQVPISGFSVMLEANGQQYEVRTDMDATIRRLVDLTQDTQ